MHYAFAEDCFIIEYLLIQKSDEQAVDGALCM